MRSSAQFHDVYGLKPIASIVTPGVQRNAERQVHEVGDGHVAVQIGWRSRHESSVWSYSWRTCVSIKVLSVLLRSDETTNEMGFCSTCTDCQTLSVPFAHANNFKRCQQRRATSVLLLLQRIQNCIGHRILVQDRTRWWQGDGPWRHKVHRALIVCYAINIG